MTLKTEIKELPFVLKIIDIFLLPLMFILAGFKKEKLQHTHGYHEKKIKFLKLSNKLGVTYKGTDKSQYKNVGGILKHLGLFHITFLGGWRDYIILKSETTPWFVGWTRLGQTDLVSLHTLKISGDKIKMLVGNEGKNLFFGTDIKGKQIKIKKIGEGKLGDGNYKNVNLY